MKMGPLIRYTIRRNIAKIMKIWYIHDWIEVSFAVYILFSLIFCSATVGSSVEKKQSKQNTIISIYLIADAERCKSTDAISFIAFVLFADGRSPTTRTIERPRD